jgi:MoxR-like ATPase
VETVASNADIVAAQKEIRAVRMAKPVADYLIDLVRRTRENTLIRLGASPRASRALFKAAKAWGAMQGRDYVTPDDVQELAVPVLAHRLILKEEERLRQLAFMHLLDPVNPPTAAALRDFIRTMKIASPAKAAKSMEFLRAVSPAVAERFEEKAGARRG